MPSNKIPFLINSFLVILMLLVTSGCSYFFNEQKKAQVVSYKDTYGSCLNSANKTLQNYFQENPSSDVTATALDDVEQCYQESVDSFITHTKSGRLESTAYSAENIELLIQKLHKNIGRISADRLRGYIELKSFLIGGDVDSISKKELEIIKSLLPTFREALQKLLPYRAILLGYQKPARDIEGYQEFKQAHDELKKQLNKIISQIEVYSGKRSGDLEFFVQFFISEFFPEKVSEQQQYSELFVHLKNFFVFEEDNLLKRKHLKPLMQQLLRSYQALGRFDGFLREEGADKLFTGIGSVASFITRIPTQLVDGSIFKGVALEALNDSLVSLESILENSLKERQGQAMSMNVIEDVLLSLHDTGLMKGSLTPKTLTLFLKRFSGTFLSPAKDKSSDISIVKINYLKKHVDEWVGRQRLLNNIFSQNNDETINLKVPSQELLRNNTMRKWIQLLKQIHVHQWDDHQRFLFTSDMRSFTYEELTVSNSLATVVELFMKPYNLTESDPLRFKITEDQAQDIYEVIRILGVELAFMDSRVDDSGRRAFRETNNFSTQNRSDQYIDFFEGYEYITMTSTAGHLADVIYAGIPKTDKCMLETIDVHGRHVIDADCFRSYFRSNFLKYFGHLRSVSAYWNNANDDEKEAFMNTLEVASRAGVISEKAFDLSEIRVMVSILNYLQSIFFLFDIKPDGLISGKEVEPGDSEVRRAEKHFLPLIQYFLVKQNPQILIDNKKRFEKSCGKGLSASQMATCIAPKIFIHLINSGSLPLNSTDVCEKATFWPLLKSDTIVNYAFKTTKASPADIMKVFSALAKITLDSHRKKVREFLLKRRQELFDSLSAEHAPECQERSSSVFCEWGREVFCNENVNETLFQYLKDDKYNLFSEADYDKNSNAAVEQTMIDLAKMFKFQSLSTRCLFPSIEKQSFWNGPKKVVGDCKQTFKSIFGF